MINKFIFFLSGLLLTLPSYVSSEVITKIEKPNSYLFISDSLPNHSTSILFQNKIPKKKMIYFEIPKFPSYIGSKVLVENVGLTKDGILIRHEIGDCFDDNCNLNYSIVFMGNRRLSLDHNLGKYDDYGMYYYVGAGNYLKNTSEKYNPIGFAVDGFPIFLSHDQETSSYQLIEGKRDIKNASMYTGKYYQDFEFVKGSGTLDECNGRFINGHYQYFITENFPFTPPCINGESYYRIMVK